MIQRRRWLDHALCRERRPHRRAFKIGFAGPDGKVAFDFTGTYDEVRAHELIAWTADDGRPMRAEFSEQNGKTLVTFILTLEPTHSAEQQRHGWSNILENLGRYLERTSS